MKLRNKLLTLLVGIGCIASIVEASNVDRNGTKSTSADNSVPDKQVNLKIVEPSSFSTNGVSLFYTLGETETRKDIAESRELETQGYAKGTVPFNAESVYFTVYFTNCTLNKQFSIDDDCNTYALSVTFTTTSRGKTTATIKSCTTSWTFPTTDSGSYLVGDFNDWTPSDNYSLGKTISLDEGETFDVVNVDSSHVGTFPTKTTDYYDLCEGITFGNNHLVCNTGYGGNYIVTYSNSVVKVIKVEEPEQDSITYAQSFNGVEDESGKIIGGVGEICSCILVGTMNVNDHLIPMWSTQKKNFATLIAENPNAQKDFTTSQTQSDIAACITKYTYILVKYNALYSAIDDFMGLYPDDNEDGKLDLPYTLTSSAKLTSYLDEDNALIIIIIASSLLAISTAAAVLLIKKKKRIK